MHIHLGSFQPLARHPITVAIPEDGVGDCEITALVRRERDPEDKLEHALDANERGLKDTVRVSPREIVELVVRFEKFSGRYMYHCHILEHEDRDMMRRLSSCPWNSGRS
jgi:spore coat protein A